MNEEKIDVLFVSNGVTFSNNHASVAYDKRDPALNEIYELYIGNNVTLAV